MKYTLKTSSRFKKSLKRVSKSKNYRQSELLKVINTLLESKELEPKYKNHKLNGEYLGYYECHVQNDLLLIYKYVDDELILYALDIGSHSDLFR